MFAGLITLHWCRSLMRMPSAYQPRYSAGRSLNPALAGRYFAHTMVGDPLAAAAVTALAQYPQDLVHTLTKAGTEQDRELLRDALEELREFFANVDIAPHWFDPKEPIAGCRAYHANSDLFVAAHVAGVLIVGFSTLISKSFFATGQLSGEFSIRRLGQNTRHLINTALPGGSERRGDDWKLTVRVRLVHALIRHLLR